MLPPPHPASARFGERSLERLQLPNRNDAQSLAARIEGCGSADHFYRPLSRPLQNVRKNRRRSPPHGLAPLGPKQFPPPPPPRRVKNAARSASECGSPLPLSEPLAKPTNSA